MSPSVGTIKPSLILPRSCFNGLGRPAEETKAYFFGRQTQRNGKQTEVNKSRKTLLISLENSSRHYAKRESS